MIILKNSPRRRFPAKNIRFMAVNNDDLKPKRDGIIDLQFAICQITCKLSDI